MLNACARSSRAPSLKFMLSTADPPPQLAASCEWFERPTAFFRFMSGSASSSRAASARPSIMRSPSRPIPGQTKVTRVSWEKKPVAGTMLTDPCVLPAQQRDGLETRETPVADQHDADRPGVRLPGRKLEIGCARSITSRKGAATVTCSSACWPTSACTFAGSSRGRYRSWAGGNLCDILSVQQRVTARFTQKDGRTLLVRKATQPEPKLKASYDALGLGYLPGGTRKRAN